MSILLVYKIKTRKIWVAGDAESFYAYNMQMYTSKTDGARKKQ